MVKKAKWVTWAGSNFSSFLKGQPFFVLSTYSPAAERAVKQQPEVTGAILLEGSPLVPHRQACCSWHSPVSRHHWPTIE